MADEKMIITIGREHGTMGEKVADKLRKQFDLPLYDKAHLLRAVEGTNDYDELNAFFNDRKVNSLLYAIAMSENVRSNDVPFGIIKKVVGDTGGIVMDSCGNYLFRNRPNTIRIFLHADKKIRVNNLMTHLGITKERAEEEIENVSHLAPIHDIGKIRVPIEILNKNGKLTIDEMEVVKQHPITGAEMTLRFPNGMTTEKLNKYSYEICRHHHERFDGSGYPDGLKGDQIPLCAQVVGLVDAYDALVSERPYKRKLKHAEAVRMIVNAECGAFSMKLLQCFFTAAMQKEWVQKVESNREE